MKTYKYQVLLFYFIMKITPIFFDLETKKSFEEVDNDNTKLGVSVAVIRKDKHNYIYYEDDVEKLIDELKKAHLVVGHNIIKFDFEVLKGYGLTGNECTSLVDRSYDFLKIIKNKTGNRVSLDHLSKNNLEGAPIKLVNGLQCLTWYKEGKIDKIVDVCMDDVNRIARLFSLIINKKPLTVLQYWLEGEDKFAPLEIKMPAPALEHYGE